MDQEEKIDRTIFRIGTPFKRLTIDINREQSLYAKNAMLAERGLPMKPNLASVELQGRRRFHGAFTGGFSAGYYNTVGSEEGFKPSSFRSTRMKKQKNQISNKPTDFMDEEDLNQMTQISLDSNNFNNLRENNPNHPEGDFSSFYTSDKSDKLIGKHPNKGEIEMFSEGFDILRKLGWRDGTGIGPRKQRKKDSKESKKKYNPKNFHESSFSIPSEPTNIHLPVPKKDTFGLGYHSEQHNSTTFLSDLLPSRSIQRSERDFYEKTMFGDNFVRVKGNSSEQRNSKVPLNLKNQPTSAFGLSVLEDYDAEDDVYAQTPIENYDKEIVLDNNNNNKNKNGQNGSKFKNRNSAKNKIKKQPKNLQKRHFEVFSTAETYLKSLFDLKIGDLRGNFKNSSQFQFKNPNEISESNILDIPKDFDCIHRFKSEKMDLVKELRKYGLTKEDSEFEEKGSIKKKKVGVLKRKRLTPLERGNLVGEQGQKTASKKPFSSFLRNTFTTGTLLNSEETKSKGLVSYSKSKTLKDSFELLKDNFSGEERMQKRFHKYLNTKLLFEAIKIPQFGIVFDDNGDFEENKNNDEIFVNKIKEEESFKKLFEEFVRNNKNHKVLERYHNQRKNGPELKTKGVYRTNHEWRPEKILCKRFNVPPRVEKISHAEKELLEQLVSNKSSAGSKVAAGAINATVERSQTKGKNRFSEEDKTERKGKKDLELSTKPEKPSKSLFKAIFESDEEVSDEQ